MLSFVRVALIMVSVHSNRTLMKTFFFCHLISGNEKKATTTCKAQVSPSTKEPFSVCVCACACMCTCVCYGHECMSKGAYVVCYGGYTYMYMQVHVKVKREFLFLYFETILSQA